MVSPHIWRMLLDRASMRKDVQFLLLGDMKQLEPVLQAREDFYEKAIKNKRVAKLAQQAGFQVDVDDPEKTADNMVAYMESVSLYDTLYGDGELLEGDTPSPLAIPSIPKYRLTENFRQSKESDNSILEYLEVLESFAQTGEMEPRGHWGQDVSRAVQHHYRKYHLHQCLDNLHSLIYQTFPDMHPCYFQHHLHQCLGIPHHLILHL